MLCKNITTQLNKQLNLEFFSSYLYLSMSAWCTKNGYNGSANWFMIQHEEERLHAFKIYDYMLDQGSEIDLLEMKRPKIKYTSLLECFDQALIHEQKMTTSLNKILDIALKEKDHASYGFLQWFVTEQIEEESSVSEIISKLKLVGDGNGMFMVDTQLAERVMTTTR